MDNSCVVNGAIVLILRLSRVVGLAPVSITPVENGYRISLSKFTVYYGYVVICIVLRLLACLLLRFLLAPVSRHPHPDTAGIANFILYSISHSNDNLNHFNALNYIQWIINWFLTILVLSVGVFSGVRRMKTFIEYAQINKKRSKSKERKKTIAMCLFFMAKLISQVSSFYHIYSSKDNLFIICVKCITTMPSLVVTIYELQLILMAFEIHKYLEAIEEDMSRLNKDITSEKKNMTCEIRTSLLALGKAYTVTCDVIAQYSASNSLTTLISFLLFTLQLTFALNNILNSIHSPDSGDRIERSCIEIVLFVFHLTRAIFIVEPWFQISKEVDKIKSHLAHVTEGLTPTGREMAPEVEVFYLQIILNKLELAPLGLFTVSRSLLGQIIGTILSYAFVVWQIYYSA